MGSDDLDQMLPEYDFSNAPRGRYAERFRGSRDTILTNASAMDRQVWVARSLLAVQYLEASLVAYWSLALDERPATAGRRVSALLEGLDDAALQRLRSDLDSHTTVPSDFYEELDELIAERNWLVHHSFNSESSSTLEAIVERSRKLNLQLSQLLLERCTSRGMPPEEVETRTQEVVEEWASGRNAA